MEGPLPGRTALLITVSPVPGKYDLYRFSTGCVSLDLLIPVGELNKQEKCYFCPAAKLFNIKFLLSLRHVIDIYHLNLFPKCQFH